jgi:beta-glucosidase
VALFYKKDFGENFIWGISTSAPQTEGTLINDGRSDSIWDVFSRKKNSILDGSSPKTGTNFRVHYKADIDLVAELGFDNFRFSISWSRIFPDASKIINPQGVVFYDELIDYILEKNIQPWITLYHWDLPQYLEDKGGWVNRDTYEHFCDYVQTIVKLFSNKVAKFIILNEPLVFTGAGYFLGIHAPGKRGLSTFLPALHHTALAQSQGLLAAKTESSAISVGTTHSYTHFEPYKNSEKDQRAVERVDLLINHLFPRLNAGLGYPIKELSFLRGVEKYIQTNDANKIKASFDFWGIQVYTRQVVKHNYFIPYIKSSIVDASKRGSTNAMGWEHYPKSITEAILSFNSYANCPDLYITENGTALHDKLSNGIIVDDERIQYIHDHLFELMKINKKLEKVKGYFVWSLTDNFEWSHGYRPRFGLVYVDYATQKRYKKKSAIWMADFLKS